MVRVSRWKWKLHQNTLQQSKVCGICLKERIEKNPVSTSSKTKGSFSVCSSPSHLSTFILESLNYASMNKFVHFSSPTLVRNRMFWYGLKSISYKSEYFASFPDHDYESQNEVMKLINMWGETELSKPWCT